jgi:hypothetical protein
VIKQAPQEESRNLGANSAPAIYLYFKGYFFLTYRFDPK